MSADTATADRWSSGLRMAVTISLLLGMIEAAIMIAASMFSIREPLATILNVALIVGASGPLVSRFAVRPLMAMATRAAAAQAVAESRADVERTFYATASHELRTPLVGILGSARLLAQHTADAPCRELVDVILSSGESLLHLINQTLDLSKLDAGHLELESRPFRPRDVVEQVTHGLAAAGQEKGVQVIADLAGALDEPVSGDAVRLRQVVYNLVGNALKFTPAGGTVTVRGRRVEGGAGDRSRLEFVVADTGVGMPPEVLRRIFDPYAQADSSVTRTHGGTGLGLTISRKLVGAMGGSIGVTSTPGRGSEFYFSVLVGRCDPSTELPGHVAVPPDTPVVPAQRRTLAPPVPRTGPARPDGALAPVGPDARRSMRVLLVDDNQVNRRVLALNLQSVGVEVNAVGDAEAALQEVREGSYELVLMDLFMPGLSGAEATTRIRNLPGIRQPIVVGLSASGRPQDRQECLDSGMDAYLAKPLNLNEFLVLLRSLPDRAVERAVPAEMH